MVMVHCIVEGHSEEAFVNQLLAPHLGAHGVFVTATRITMKDEDRRTEGRVERRLYRGGLLHYRHDAPPR